MSINIFVLCDQDLHETEAGGSRAVILINNYLASQEGITVFTSFKNLSPVDNRIIEIPITSNFTKEAISNVIKEKSIDILLIPEGGKYAHLGRLSVENTKCKVITELHQCPGYEVKRIWYDGFHAFFKKNISFIKRIYSLIKFLLFPFSIILIKLIHLKRFQQAYYDADQLVVLSTPYINEYKKEYFLRDNSRITAIENALSFNNEISIEEINFKNKTILIVSRFEERSKRLSIILKIWNKIYVKYPDWNLQILGTGGDEQYYHKLAKKLKLNNITFTGRVDPEKYYTNASIFIMCSAYEGWPMVLLEALQKGCVPICMNTFSALHEIINDKIDGFIIPDKKNNLIEKIEYLINNPETRINMANNGVINSRRFLIDNIGSKWIRLFNNILS